MILVDRNMYVYYFKDNSIRYWASKDYTKWVDYGKTWDWKIDRIFSVGPSILSQWSKEDE